MPGSIQHVQNDTQYLSSPRFLIENGRYYMTSIQTIINSQKRAKKACNINSSTFNHCIEIKILIFLHRVLKLIQTFTLSTDANNS